jgi:hypothetical protein
MDVTRVNGSTSSIRALSHYINTLEKGLTVYSCYWISCFCFELDKLHNEHHPPEKQLLDWE